MKNSKTLILLFFILFLAGCKNAEVKDAERVDKLCDAVIFATANELIKTHHELKFVGFGGGGVYGINFLSFCLTLSKEVNLEEGRKLLVECVEKFLENINKNEKLRPELKDYPFYAKNIEIEIYTPPGDKPLYPHLSYLVCSKGDAMFCYFIKKGDEEKCIEEPYEKTLEIVKNSSKTLDKKDNEKF